MSFYQDNDPTNRISELAVRPHTHLVRSLREVHPRAGMTHYRTIVSKELPLDSLVVNQGSETLVVSFHGALDRSKYALPRFERSEPIIANGYNYLGFSDPWLHVNETIQMAWYTGDRSFDLPAYLAEWAATVADRLGARNLILSGSSGGGFAALQTAALIPGSVALVFNPQTEISRYVLPNGSIWAQRNYLNAVLPELAPPDPTVLGTGIDWSEGQGDRFSAIRRYEQPTSTRILYATSTQDFHHAQHYMPFASAMRRNGQAGRIRTIEYADGATHRPPGSERFLEYLGNAITWAREPLY